MGQVVHLLDAAGDDPLGLAATSATHNAGAMQAVGGASGGGGGAVMASSVQETLDALSANLSKQVLGCGVVRVCCLLRPWGPQGVWLRAMRGCSRSVTAVSYSFLACVQSQLTRSPDQQPHPHLRSAVRAAHHTAWRSRGAGHVGATASCPHVC